MLELIYWGFLPYFCKQYDLILYPLPWSSQTGCHTSNYRSSFTKKVCKSLRVFHYNMRHCLIKGHQGQMPQTLIKIKLCKTSRYNNAAFLCWEGPGLILFQSGPWSTQSFALSSLFPVGNNWLVNKYRSFQCKRDKSNSLKWYCEKLESQLPSFTSHISTSRGLVFYTKKFVGGVSGRYYEHRMFTPTLKSNWNHTQSSSQK